MKKYALLQTQPKVRLLGVFVDLATAEAHGEAQPASVTDFAIAAVGEPDSWLWFMKTFSTAEMRELLGTLPGSAHGLPLAPGQRALADRVAEKLADREPFVEPVRTRGATAIEIKSQPPAPVALEEIPMTATTETTIATVAEPIAKKPTATAATSKPGAASSTAKRPAPARKKATRTTPVAAKAPQKAKAGRSSASKTRPAAGPIAEPVRKGALSRAKGPKDHLGRAGSISRFLAEAIVAGKTDAEAAALAAKTGKKVGGRGLEAYAGYRRWQLTRAGVLPKPKA